MLNPDQLGLQQEGEVLMVLFGDVKPGQVFKVVGAGTDNVQYWTPDSFQTAVRVWKSSGVWIKCRPIQRGLFVHNGPTGSNPEVQVVNGSYTEPSSVSAEAAAS